jgi:hypothetical protein
MCICVVGVFVCGEGQTKGAEENQGRNNRERGEGARRQERGRKRQTDGQQRKERPVEHHGAITEPMTGPIMATY